MKTVKVFFPFLVVIIGIINTSFTSWIPGCYSVWDLNRLYESAAESGTFQDIPACFCDNATDIISDSDGVQVSCLFGSTVWDLADVLDSVNLAGKRAVNVHLSHVDFEDTGMPANFFHNHNATPNILIITACPGRDPITIEDGAFDGMEESLTELIINDCKLKEVPNAITNLTSLEFLEIRYSLQSIRNGSLQGLSSLKRLNISENYLRYIEPGSFQGLESLENLVLGPQNYFNDTIFPEINTLANLQYLDLHNLQLNNIPYNAFTNLKYLKKLILTGNNLVNLTKNTFNGLENLEELDLRVNLLENIENGLFMPLKKLTELNLAGNYIAQIYPELFQGPENLTTLDIGWNEFYRVPNNTFANLTTLKYLDLRHNLKLRHLEKNAFYGLENLQQLNLSATNVSVFQQDLLMPLANIKKLHLTGTRISELKNDTFQHSSQMSELFLNNAMLQSLPEDIFNSMDSLEQIDLSENPWLCDVDLAPTIQWMFSRMYTAAETNEAFYLRNINLTTCDRPYSLRGQLLMDLDPLGLEPYDSEDDTTIATTTTPKVTTDYSLFTTDRLDYNLVEYTSITNSPIEDDDTSTWDTSDIDNPQNQKSDSRSSADVNRNLNQERESPSGTPIGIAVAGVIAALVITIFIILIIWAVRKKQQHTVSSHQSSSTEMTEKHPNKLAAGEEQNSIQNGKATSVKVHDNEENDRAL